VGELSALGNGGAEIGLSRKRAMCEVTVGVETTFWGAGVAYGVTWGGLAKYGSIVGLGFAGARFSCEGQLVGMDVRKTREGIWADESAARPPGSGQCL
jgi:hypothetical protein